MKTLKNVTGDGAEKNVPDLKWWGNKDTFKLISKAWSEEEGWMKSTKAMEIPGVGCVVQVTTQQRNPKHSGFEDGGYADDNYVIAEAVCFVPNVSIRDTGANSIDGVTSRELVWSAEMTTQEKTSEEGS